MINRKSICVIIALCGIFVLSSCDSTVPTEENTSTEVTISESETVQTPTPMPKATSTPAPEVVVEVLYDESHIHADWENYEAANSNDDDGEAMYSRLTEDYMYKYVPGTSDGNIMPFTGTVVRYIEGIDEYGEWYSDLEMKGFVDETGTIVCDPVYYSIEDFSGRFWLTRSLDGECDLYSFDGNVAISGYEDYHLYNDKIYCLNYVKTDEPDEYDYYMTISAEMDIYDCSGELEEKNINITGEELYFMGVLDDTHIIVSCTYNDAFGYYIVDIVNGDTSLMEYDPEMTYRYANNDSVSVYDYDGEYIYEVYNYRNSIYEYYVLSSQDYTSLLPIDDNHYAVLKMDSINYDNGYPVINSDDVVYIVDINGNEKKLTNSYHYEVYDGLVYILDESKNVYVYNVDGELVQSTELSSIKLEDIEELDVNFVIADNGKKIIFTFWDDLYYDYYKRVISLDNPLEEELYRDELWSNATWNHVLCGTNNDDGTSSIICCDTGETLATVEYDNYFQYSYCDDNGYLRLDFYLEGITEIYNSEGNLVFRYEALPLM